MSETEKEVVFEQVDTVIDAKNSVSKPDQVSKPKEVGGRKAGLEPTRYGDWERNGRCIDF